MALLKRIQARRVRISEQTLFLDIHGKPLAPMTIAEIGDSDDDIEIPREDLVGILADAVSDAATIRFDDSIKASADSDGHVDVQYASGRTVPGRMAKLLDATRPDPSFYFCAASQVHLACWHRGRVVLVGNASYSAAFLSGRGTSLALTGARRLAEELD